MAIAVQSKTADAMLSMGVPSQSGGGANNSQSVQSGQDFGGMVKQKQQEIRQDAAKDGGNGTESADAREDVRNDGTAVSARQQGQQEIPHEQYILAAALILIPNVGTVTMEAATEETAVAVEVEPAFVADMQIESLTDLPVAEVADESGNAFSENREEALPEEFQIVEETPAEYVPKTGYRTYRKKRRSRTRSAFWKTCHGRRRYSAIWRRLRSKCPLPWSGNSPWNWKPTTVWNSSPERLSAL